MENQSPGRKDRLIRDNRRDAYTAKGKLPASTRCTECGAVFAKGRWSWETAGTRVTDTLCPACRRIADRFPAGHIELKGPFFEQNRSEIVHLVRNVEKQEKARHPLERIMAIRTDAEATVVTTTGAHLGRRIGEALSRSYKGSLSFQYSDSEETIRVFWHR